MNAKLRAAGNVIDLSSCDATVKFVVAGSSSIESSSKCGIYRASYGDIIIQGPKMLTINCYSSAIAFDGYDRANSLFLQNVALKATTIANAAGRAIEIPSGNLAIEGSNVDITNRAGVAVYLSKGESADYATRGNATITNSVISAVSKGTSFQLDGNLNITSSTMQLSSDNMALYSFGDLLVTKSTFAITSNSEITGALSVEGDFILDGSNAEIHGTKHTIFAGTSLPKMVGSYTIVAGADRDSSAPYDEAFASTYQYFFAEPLDKPTDPSVDPEQEIDPSEDPDFEFSEEPTEEAESPETTKATIAAPTPPPSNKNNSTLFWILAILMVLGAGGAATVAFLMFRKNAIGEYDEEIDEEEPSEEEPQEEAAVLEPQEEPADAEPQEETEVVSTEEAEAISAEEEPEVLTEDESEESAEEEPKKVSLKSLKQIFSKLLKDDTNE